VTRQTARLSGVVALFSRRGGFPLAQRRPDPNIDAGINTLRSNLFSNYNALQMRLEKRFSISLRSIA